MITQYEKDRGGISITCRMIRWISPDHSDDRYGIALPVCTFRDCCNSHDMLPRILADGHGHSSEVNRLKKSKSARFFCPRIYYTMLLHLRLRLFVSCFVCGRRYLYPNSLNSPFT